MEQVWHANVRGFQRHTWVLGARRSKEENLRDGSLLFPWYSLFLSLAIPQRTFKAGKFLPLGVPIFPCVFMLASHLCHQVGLIH